MNLFSDLVMEDTSRALVAAGGGGGKKFVPTYVPCVVCDALVVQKPGLYLDLDCEM